MFHFALFFKSKNEFLSDFVRGMGAEVNVTGMGAEVNVRGMGAEVNVRGMGAEVNVRGMGAEVNAGLQVTCPVLTETENRR